MLTKSNLSSPKAINLLSSLKILCEFGADWSSHMRVHRERTAGLVADMYTVTAPPWISFCVPAGDLLQLALVPVDVAVAAAHAVVFLGAAVDGAVGPVQLVQAERNRNVENLQVQRYSSVAGFFKDEDLGPSPRLVGSFCSYLLPQVGPRIF